MLDTLRELVAFFSKREKIWLVPLILLLVIVALLFLVSQVVPIPVFVYPLI